MIARIWHGKTTIEKADAYMQEYFLQTGLADYQATEGNRGVLVLRKDEEGQVDFLMLTLWENEEAIRKFAGDDIDKARYYPEDKKYFDEMEPNVTHYDVLINKMRSLAGAKERIKND
jgi:heme-degrading monooxygenase HmoA